MIKYKIIRNKNIKNNQILAISKLKDSFWPYGIKNQKIFFNLILILMIYISWLIIIKI